MIMRISVLFFLSLFILPVVAHAEGQPAKQFPTFEELKKRPGVTVSKDGQMLEFPGGVSFSNRSHSFDDHSGKGAVLCTRAIWLSLRKTIDDCPVISVVKRNNEEAYFWLNLVPETNPNHNLAQSLKNMVAKRLSSQQLADLKTRLQNWKPQITNVEIKDHATVHERADHGDPKAQFEVGAILEHQWNYLEAEKWYLKAAKQGYPIAQYSLGKMYAEGGGDVSDADFKKMLDRAISKTDDFIIKNSLTPVTRTELEEQEKNMKLPYGCIGYETARSMLNDFESVPAEKFDSSIEDSLSVPRPPVGEPCL